MEKNLFYQVMILVLQVLPSPVHVIGHEEEGRVVVAVPGKKPKRASTGSLDCVNRKSRLRQPEVSIASSDGLHVGSNHSTGICCHGNRFFLLLCLIEPIGASGSESEAFFLLRSLRLLI